MSPLAPDDLGTILSVWAHPDDETYLAGGVMAAARAHGQRVVCVSATAGEHGTGDPALWPPERLGRVRRWEASAAMAVLGVGEHHVLGHEDGRLTGADPGGVASVERLLDDVRPDTILTFGSDGMTFHPDHVAVHHWVTRAWARRGRQERLLYASSSVDFRERYGERFEQWNVYMTDERPTGVPCDQLDVHLVLCGAALDQKLTALRAMASQTAELISLIGVHRYAEQVSEESFVAASRSGGVRARVDGDLLTAATGTTDQQTAEEAAMHVVDTP